MHILTNEFSEGEKVAGAFQSVYPFVVRSYIIPTLQSAHVLVVTHVLTSAVLFVL